LTQAVDWQEGNARKKEIGDAGEIGGKGNKEGAQTRSCERIKEN
jgi:hypothetical protein